MKYTYFHFNPAKISFDAMKKNLYEKKDYFNCLFKEGKKSPSCLFNWVSLANHVIKFSLNKYVISFIMTLNYVDKG